jgi:hypothetical protein
MYNDRQVDLAFGESKILTRKEDIMKKFMLFVLLVVAPAFAVADTIGCVLGTAVGVGLGSKIGQGNGTVAAQVILGLGGCDTGSRIEDGTYGARNRPQVAPVYVMQGSSGEDYGYDGRPPQCYDQGSGGHADCDELARRYNGVSYRRQVQPVRRAVFNTSHPADPARRAVTMFDRPEMRAQAVEKVASKAVVDNQGVTVDNYWNSPMIHPACKVLNEETGLPLNHGADGKCLLRKAEVLRGEQLKCDCIAGEGTACSATYACPKKYNPGVWAGIYDRIGNELVELQQKEQAGVIATVSR